MRAVALVSAVIGTVYFAAWGLVHQAWGNPPLLLELVAVMVLSLALDGALYVSAIQPRTSLEVLTRVGVIYFALRCVLLSAYPVRLDVLAGFDPPRLTLTCVAVVCLPILLPIKPRTALLVCTPAAATQPLALWLLSDASRTIVQNSAINAVIAVVAAYLSARVAYGLSGAVERARHLGAYHLQSLLAETDVSEVWLARHRLLARPAAVKRIRVGNVGRTVLARFVREAQVTSLLTSPHTVTLYDYGISEDGSPYYAMELLEGEDLQSLVERRGPLSPREVVDIVLQVSESLEEAHRHGLIHRDLKPSNLFRCRAGRHHDFVKVLDFGLAQFRPRPEFPFGSALVSGRVLGTPAYVVPELVLGRKVDERGDIYQLGCIMFFLLTGRPVFMRQNVEMTCMAHVVDAAPSVLDHVSVPVPEALNELVAQCLEKRPEDRPPSARALRRLLEPIRNELDFAGTTLEALPPVVPPDLRERPQNDVPGFAKEAEPKAVALLEGGHGLSGEVAQKARRRFERLVEIIGLTTIGYYLLWGLLNAQGSPSLMREVFAITALSFVVDAAMVLLARSSRVSTKTLILLARVYLVARCFAIAYAPVRLNLLIGLDAPRITYACVALSLFPLFIPTAPKKILVPLILAGATQPLSLLIAGVHTGVVDSALNAAVAVFIGYYIALVSSKLRLAARQGGRLGSYHLMHRIGSGAMGEVWSAEHRLLARPAAIKLITGAMEATADRTLMRRFEREAQVTAMMTSPHAVRVFDYGMSSDGALYFAMELLDGRDLGRLVREDGPRSPAETVRIAREVCDALGEAHSLGLVHRDLKPENLMSARIGLRDDFTKVLDFGVVELRRRLEMRSQKSAMASAPVAGTPGYMAPEMITSSGADGRADLYQLGCVMFFLLTGRNVFEEPSAVATAMAHVTAPPPRVGEVLGRRIPEALELIVARCLAKDPGQRFATAEDVDRALSSVALPTVVMTERVEGFLH